MSEMIERVARTLCVSNGGDTDKLSGALGVWWKAYEADARTAIEAMRIPTEAISTHPIATCYNYGPYASKEVSRIWQEMIDAALSEKP